MADNVAISAGSGTSIATDDISGSHYQIVKLAMGALDSQSLLQKATVSAVLASTVDTTIASSSAILYGVSAYTTELAGRCVIQIRDSTSGTTGTMVTGFSLSSAQGSGKDGFRWFGPQGLKLTSGIRVVLPTTPVATVSCYYISPA